MQSVLNAALPIFGLILTGYLCGLLQIFSKAAAVSLNTFVVTLALPALVFVAMARTTPEQLGHTEFMVAYAGCVLVNSSIGFCLSRYWGEPLANATMMGLNASYNNVGFMGLPLCLILFGSDGLPPAIVATLFTACIHFLGSITLIEADLNRGASLRRRLRDVGLSLLRNPLFLAPVAGLAVGLSGIGLPLSLTRYGELLGAAAAPCALICIGLVLAQEPLDIREMPRIGLLVALKLVLQPALAAFLVFRVLPMPPLWASAAVILSALPTGPGAFSLAKAYDLRPAAASGVILVSHVASVVTLSLVLVWLV